VGSTAAAARSPAPSPNCPRARTPFACIVIAAPVTGHCARASTSSTVSPMSFSAIAADNPAMPPPTTRIRPTQRPSVSASHPKRDATSITPLLVGGVAVLENRSARREDALSPASLSSESSSALLVGCMRSVVDRGLPTPMCASLPMRTVGS
jgi:hypothetical protein